MNTRIIAKAAVFSGEGDVLALRRSKTDVRRPLQWDLPGGYCDPGEEPSQAVLREIQEEAGLNIKTSELRYATTDIREWIEKDRKKIENVVFLFYIAYTDNKVVKLSYEHAEYRWMKPQAALSEFEYPLHKEFIQHLLANKLVKS